MLKQKTTLPVGEDAIQQALDRKAHRRQTFNAIVPFAGLVFIIVYFTVATDLLLLGSGNLANMFVQCFTTIMVASGASLIYAYGGMDMSFGMAAGIIEYMVAVLLIKYTSFPVPVALLLSVVLGMLICMFNGIIEVVTHIPAFVVTMCVKNICSGILQSATSEGRYYIDFNRLAIFNTVWMRVIFAVIWVLACFILLEKTRLGKGVMAMGGNATVAEQTGLKTSKLTILACMLAGISVGLVAFFQLARIGYVAGNAGQNIEFNVMFAFILGGFPMSGGFRARLRMVITGALTATVLTNGLTLVGASADIIGMVKGALFIVIVAVSYDRTEGDLVM